MIPPHLIYQVCISFLEQNDCTPLKCGELSEYSDNAHTEVGVHDRNYTEANEANAETFKSELLGASGDSPYFFFCIAPLGD